MRSADVEAACRELTGLLRLGHRKPGRAHWPVMTRSIRSHFLSAVARRPGRRRRPARASAWPAADAPQTIVEEAPVASQSAAGASSASRADPARHLPRDAAGRGLRARPAGGVRRRARSTLFQRRGSAVSTGVRVPGRPPRRSAHRLPRDRGGQPLRRGDRRVRGPDRPPRQRDRRRPRAPIWPSCRSTCGGSRRVQPADRSATRAPVRVGDPTLTIGNPFGVDRTLTSGIVSALQHQIQAADGFSDRQRDPDRSADQPRQLRRAAARRRRSRDRDQLADRSRRATATGGQAVAFAVPIDTANEILAARSSTAGRCGSPIIGLRGVAIRAAEPRSDRLRRSSAAARRRSPGSARRRDRARRRSTAVALDERRARAWSSTRSPGQIVRVDVRRRGRQRTIVVVLGSRTGADGVRRTPVAAPALVRCGGHGS